MTDKPDMLRAWASEGDKVNPDDIDPERRARGWEPSVPFFHYENFQQNIQDKYLQHLESRGIPSWDTLTNYKINAWAHYADALWIARIPNTGILPGSNDGVWTDYLKIIDPVGVIKWYSGAISGIQAGWALCNGQNGTPDLSSNFLFGDTVAGNRGGSNSVVTTTDDAHTHTVNPEGALPTTTTNFSGTHYHLIPDQENHSHAGMLNPHTLSIDQIPPHTHQYINAVSGSGDGNGGYPRYPGPEATQPVGGSSPHTHDVVTGAIPLHSHSTSVTPNHAHNIPGVGSHIHTMELSPGHAHTISDIRPLYYTLALIMKVT
jgi:hypothetical protein